MRISEVSEEKIVFDNGSEISFYHNSDCCEYNYADFTQLEELALVTDFKEELKFEAVEEAGFRFGSEGTQMFFVPCYSEQNGYYSTDLDILFNGRNVFNIECDTSKIY